MKLLVQFPTLNRPTKFLNCFTKYITKVSGKHAIHFNINCDIADGLTNQEYVLRTIKDIVEKSQRAGNKITYKVNLDENTTKIGAINSHIEGEFDIVMCASDDMIPEVLDWDDIIATEMVNAFPALDGCIHFNDGYTNGKLITFSILGVNLYRQFGYIYHPDYKSLYCDNEFTQVVRALDKERYIDRLIIKHAHYGEKGNVNSGQLDEAAKKTLLYAGRDQQVFEERQRRNFPKEMITND